MADPFLGAMSMYASPHVLPLNWADCNGQLMTVVQNEGLFSLLSNMYGGDGRSNFALPEMRGRIPVHRNVSGFPAGIPCQQGQMAGVETITLDINQIPSHNHSFQVTTGEATTDVPADNYIAKSTLYTITPILDPDALATNTISTTGETGAHDNIMPAQVIRFIIALKGTYPPRN